MTLTRRSFLAGLITAPAIVAACNIMKVRPVENLFQIGPFANPDTLTIEHIRKMMEFMREAHISAFSSEGIVGLGYISYVSPAIIEEGRRRFRAANPHYGCNITPQMAMDFL